MPLTSLHIASKVDAVGFLANAVGRLGPWACLLEGYNAGGALETILGAIVLRSWGCEKTFRPFPQPHNNTGEQRLLTDTAFTGEETEAQSKQNACPVSVPVHRSAVGQSTHSGLLGQAGRDSV